MSSDERSFSLGRQHCLRHLARRTGLDAADVDRDGREDLFLLADDGLTTMLSQPAGTFVEVPTGIALADRVAVGDAEGDGHVDAWYVTPGTDAPYKSFARVTIRDDGTAEAQPVAFAPQPDGLLHVADVDELPGDELLLGSFGGLVFFRDSTYPGPLTPALGPEAPAPIGTCHCLGRDAGRLRWRRRRRDHRGARRRDRDLSPELTRARFG